MFAGDTSSRWRRLSRFRLQTLLIVTTLSSIIFAYIAWEIRLANVQAEAVATLRGAGFIVIYDYEVSFHERSSGSRYGAGLRYYSSPKAILGLECGTPAPPGPQWIRNALGEDVVAEVREVFLPKPLKPSPQQGLVHPHVLQAISRLVHLQKLGLQECEINKATLSSLSNLRDLRDLDLTGSTLDDTGLNEVCKLPNLEALHLADTRISDSGLRPLSQLSKLRWINLSHMHIGDQGIVHLTMLPSLRSVILADIGITDVGVKSLSNIRNIEELILARNFSVSDRGLRYLKRCKELRTLDLRETSVDDSALATVATMTKLQFLDLSDTNVTDDGIVKLKTLTQLEDLSTTDTRVTALGMSRLASLPKLRLPSRTNEGNWFPMDNEQTGSHIIDD